RAGRGLRRRRQPREQPRLAHVVRRRGRRRPLQADRRHRDRRRRPHAPQGRRRPETRARRVPRHALQMQIRAALLAIALVACDGKIAAEEQALSGTCGKHATTTTGTPPACTSNDSVTCSTGTYVVTCDCAARSCTCAKDGIAVKSVPTNGCVSCALA